MRDGRERTAEERRDRRERQNPDSDLISETELVKKNYFIMAES